MQTLSIGFGYHKKIYSVAFKIRSHIVTEIPCNFKNKYKKKGNNGLICGYCTENQEMDQSHCMRCPAWSELRKDLDLSNISDLVIFFRKLLNERERLEVERVKQTASHDSED